MIYNLLIQINVVHEQNVLDTTQKKKFPSYYQFILLFPLLLSFLGN